MPTTLEVIESLNQEIAGLKSWTQQRIDTGAKPLREEIDRAAKGLASLEKGVADLQRAALLRGGNERDDGRIVVREGRLAGFDYLDLALLRSIIASQKNPERLKDLAAETDRATTAVTKGLTSDRILAWHEHVAKAKSAYTGPMGTHAAGQYQASAAAWARDLIGMHQKAAMDAATAASGGNLVPTFEAAELWADVNLSTVILPLFDQINMPTNPFTWPSQFGDTNWYPTTENVQVLTTAPSTPRSTLTAYGLKTGVPFSDELDEDSIVAFIPALRTGLVRNASEIIDNVILNGDTTVTNGINSDGTTISASTAGKAHWLLGFDGLIHLPIIDNTAQRTDINGAVATTTYNAALRKLAKYATPQRTGDVVFISDVNTAIASLGITQFMTVDVAGARATLSSGELMNVFGKPLVHTNQMVMADTDGKVTDSGNATSTGRLLAVNTTQWKVGFKRQIEVEAAREAGKGQTTLYVSTRIALAERTGTRSTATHTAIAYDITGVS